MAVRFPRKKAVAFLLGLGLCLSLITAWLYAQVAQSNARMPAQIAETQPQDARQASLAQSALTFFVKVVGSAGALALLLYASYKGGHFLVGRRPNAAGVPIVVRGTHMLGPKKSLVVVEALDHVVLLGVTEQQISVLLDLERQSLSEEQRALWGQADAPPTTAFQQVLAHMTRR